MLAMVPLYPYCCNPDDVMFAQESMRERYVFTDVQLRGYYPSYVLNEWSVADLTSKWKTAISMYCVKAPAIILVSAIT